MQSKKMIFVKMEEMKFKKEIVLVLSFFIFFVSYSQKSTIKPVSKSPQYIMHVVKFGETLSKIAKKYDVTVTEILKINPSVTAENLNQEQILRIPNIGNKKLLTASKSEDKELIPKVNNSQPLQPKSGKYHTVLAGETMYHISKLYGIKVEDIQKWNNLTDFNLKVGSQIIIINPNFKANPNAYKEIPTISEIEKEKLEPQNKIENKTIKPVIEKNSITKPEVIIPKEKPAILPNENKVQPILAKSGKYHTILAGETMYSISKLYAIKVADIQKWNNLHDFNLKVGSQILVADPNSKTILTDKIETTPVKVIIPEKVDSPNNSVLKNTETKEDSNQYVEKPEVQAIENETQSDLAKIFNSQAAQGRKNAVKGTGAPMTTTLGAMESVYFAMHKTLPIGTVVKVKNLVNSKVIYAKIIGKLPETDENKHVIVRYSLGVKKMLKLQNGKCYIQIEYSN